MNRLWKYVGLIGLISAATQAQDWSTYHSEEQGAFSCADGFISSIQCSGRYCDDMRYACDASYKKSKEDYDSYWSEWLSEEDGAFKCDDGMFVDAVRCNYRYCDNVSMRCTRLELPAKTGMTSPGECKTSKRFSEEAPTNQIVLEKGQLFAGFACFGKYCDNKEMRYCAAYGGSIPVAGTWIRVGSQSGASYSETVSIGRSNTSENKTTAGLSLTAGISGTDGVVTVSTSVTASFQEEIAKSSTYSDTDTVTIKCENDRNSAKPEVVAYQFVLANGQPAIMQKTKEYRCHYFSTDQVQVAPRCEPAYCQGEFCQSCLGGKSVLQPIVGVNTGYSKAVRQ